MPSAPYDLSTSGTRAGALFASPLQRSDEPSASQVRRAIATARARRAEDLGTAAVLPDPRAERRRRLAEPDLEFRAFCSLKGLPASSPPQLERAWDAYQAERYRRGKTSQRAAYAGNPFRHADDHPGHSAHQGSSGNGRLSGADDSVVTGTPGFPRVRAN
jgi:hypothetical protein